eukprot:SAG31_NODE_643_length_13291_cov_6.294042_2_plen_508_part_00
MAQEAERGLLARYPSTPVSSVDNSSMSPFETKVAGLLSELRCSGAIIGAQVCVYYEGAKIVDLQAGQLGEVDRRAVQADTLFNCFSVTKGVCATMLHLLAEKLCLDYSSTVSQWWPEFGVRNDGKERCTVQQLLCHQAGLQHALPPDLDLESFADWNKIVRHLEQTPPVTAPGEQVSYHYYTFGWLVGELCRRLDAITTRMYKNGRGFAELVRAELAAPLGLEDEFMIGVGSLENAAALEQQGRLAVLSSTMVAGRNAARAEEVQEFVEAMERAAEQQKTDIAGGAPSADANFDSEQGVPRPPTLRAGEAATLSELLQSMRGKEYLLDPRIFNSKSLRAAEIPAANGHFSARALASFYASLVGSTGSDAAKSLLSEETVEHVSKECARHVGSDFLTPNVGQTQHWGLGYHLFPFEENVPECTNSTEPPSSANMPTTAQAQNSPEVEEIKGAFGHAGLGGSIAFADQTRKLSMAITVNMLSSERLATKKLVKLITKELDLGGHYVDFL